MGREVAPGPAFDNAILGYAGRSRIIDEERRGLSVAGQRAVLVDGRVAATWTVEDGTVLVNPLRRLCRGNRAEIAEQAIGNSPPSCPAAAATGRASRPRPAEPRRPEPADGDGAQRG